MLKHTKIVCTLGPSCETLAIIKKMTLSGMNVARLNFSHGTHENHAMLIKNIRKAEEETGEPVAILQDLQGPKIRIGLMPEAGVKIKEGEKIVFNTAKEKYAGNELPITFPGLEKFLKIGERLLLDDGHLEVKIKEIDGSRLVAEVIEGGTILSHKGLNFPNSKLYVPPMGEKDKDDLKFGVKAGVDMIAMSFVHEAKDILDLRYQIKEFEKELDIKPEQPIHIIAKIERHEAVENIDGILEAADGIMVARGDLGLEIPASEVPLVQKRIIDKANAAAKPVIVATQMLDSMRENRRPTRAEVSDVSNAVIDHADALMLSNETATGKYPILAVETMAKIITTTEKSHYDNLNIPPRRITGLSVDRALAELSRLLAEEIGGKLILAASLSGETGRLISHVRPELPILVATATERARRQLNLTWGVQPFILVPCRTIEELVERAMSYIKEHKIAKSKDKMIVVAGEPVGHAGHVNLVEVREIL